MIEKGSSLAWLQREPESWEDLAYDHRMDLSGSIYTRMKELGMTQAELADALEMDQAQISRIIRGKQNLTIKTLAKLEVALKFRLDQGFRYTPKQADSPRMGDSQDESGQSSIGEQASSETSPQVKPAHLRQVLAINDATADERPTAAMG